MVSIYEISSKRLIEEAAKELKKMPEMAPPSWAFAAKTGVHKERPPLQEDWWYVRSAAILRSIYKLGPIGVSKLRTKYGGRKNRGYAPDKTFKAGGNIIRKILQKLELIGFIKQAQVGVHKGRITTPKGKSFVDKIAAKIAKEDKPKAKEQKKEEPKSEEEKPKKSKSKKDSEIQQPQESAEEPKPVEGEEQ